MKPTLRQIFKATNAVYDRRSLDYPESGVGGFPKDNQRAINEYNFYKATYIVLGWHYEYDNYDIKRNIHVERIGRNAALFVKFTCEPKKAEIVKEIREEIYKIVID
jgi:hypothetical protein